MKKEQNNICPFLATHPGTIVRDEMSVNPYILERYSTKHQVNTDVIRNLSFGKGKITEEIAGILEEIFDISSAYWLNLQKQYENDLNAIKIRNIEQIKQIEIWKVLNKFIPLKYLERLGYLGNGYQEDIEKIWELFNIKSIEELISHYAEFYQFFFKESKKFLKEKKILFSWVKIIQYEAAKIDVPPFSIRRLNKLNNELNDVFDKNIDTVNQTHQLLNKYGIKYLKFYKPDNVTIKNFTFYSKNNPTIVVSQKLKDVYGFAFSIMHQLAHIKLHLDKENNPYIIDYDTTGKRLSVEKEANNLAVEYLIPKNVLSAIINEISKTKKFDYLFLMYLRKKYKINPAIIYEILCQKDRKYRLNDNIYVILK